MTAATVTITDYAIGDIVTRENALNALKNALVVAGWTVLNDTALISGILTVDLSRNQGSGKAKSTIYMRLYARSSNFGYQFGILTSDTPDFAAASIEIGVCGWIETPANTAFKFVSVLHPECAMVHIYALSSGVTNYGYVGVIRPLQKPSYIDEDIYPYAIQLSGVGINADFKVWGSSVGGKNPYDPNDAIFGLIGQQKPQNDNTFNFLTTAREVFPSFVFRTSYGWYGTTSADIVKAVYEFPGDKLILPSGAQYACCVPWGGAAIRI